MRRRIHVSYEEANWMHKRRIHVSYEEEDTCVI
jgi:hypothetical protein